MVHKLETDNIGKAVSKVHATVSGEVTVFACDIIIIAAGATKSAALLLRTTSIHHPNGLSNNNEFRYNMSHINGCMIAFTLNKRYEVRVTSNLKKVERYGLYIIRKNRKYFFDSIKLLLSQKFSGGSAPW
jgi:hypothetical protein